MIKQKLLGINQGPDDILVSVPFGRDLLLFFLVSGLLLDVMKCRLEFAPFRLPGERRALCRAERMRAGVPLAPALLDQLERLAQELHLEPLRARAG